jgi:hypothetical protein
MHSDPSLSSKEQSKPAGCLRRASGWLVASALAVALISVAQADRPAGPRTVTAAYTAVTANMSPAGVNLRIQILEWQEAAARAEVVATLAAGADAATPLAKLPTVGYIWPNSSPVGYSLKYAHRASLPGGGERVTLVTDRRIGSYDYKGWSVPGSEAAKDLPYSVVELDLTGSGTGTGNLSLATEVMLDETAGTVSLAAGSAAASVLQDVKRETNTP